jgi:YbbR domain-containing protein
LDKDARVKNLLTHNIGWKLLSLMAAIGVWMNVASEPELTTIVSVPVEYKNFPANFEISSDIVESIDVEAHGPAGLLRNLGDGHLAAVIDLSNIRTPGERTFTLTESLLRIPRDVTLIRTIPAQVRFRFEHRATRLVPVKISFSGKLPPGKRVVSFAADPPELRIAGPESRVMAVESLDADPFDLTGESRTASRVVAVYTAEPQVRILNAPRVTVKVQIAKH